MKKVLIVTYYWPPAGGPGVQRVLKFAKYLPEYGWQPVVLTVREGEYHAIDPSQEEEIPRGVRVYRTGSWEPHRLYKRFTGMAADEKVPVSTVIEGGVGWKKRVAFWLRGNLFIPDARIGWRPFAIRAGMEIIEEQEIDLIFSSSPPQTVHLIARRLAARSGKPWAADFRDPWTNIYYYADYRRVWPGRAYDRCLERSVLESADRVIGVSRQDIEDDFQSKVPGDMYRYIPNGFDEADFQGQYDGKNSSRRDDGFTIVYSGTLKPNRVPVTLLRVMKTFHERGLIQPEGFRVRFIGNAHPAVPEMEVVTAVREYVEFLPYVPHRRVMDHFGSADALVLVVDRTENNRNVVPGKVFEYVRCMKPILAFGPEGGETDRVLRETGFDGVIGYEDEAGTRRLLERILDRKKSDDGVGTGDADAIQGFERKRLTERLATYFDDMVAGRREGGFG